MKCELCNEDVYVYYRGPAPEGVLLAGNTINSLCIHIECLVNMKTHLDQLQDQVEELKRLTKVQANAEKIAKLKEELAALEGEIK